MNRQNAFASLIHPETLAQNLWHRIPAYIRRTFCAAVVFGLAAHLYMFTNKFTNHDDVNSQFGNSYGAASGRWLRPFLVRAGGGASMPWLVGLLSVLCLAGVACLTVSLLRVRRPLGCAVIAAILVSFPTVLSTFTYMYSAFAYFFSLLLAVSGAWAAVRWKWWGSAAGAVAIALSLSVYQSYLPAAAALMVGALLLETLDGEKSFQALFLEGARLLGTLIAALIAYMISVQISTHGNGLVNYMGLQDMGKLSLEELPQLVSKAYSKYYLFFWNDECAAHFWLLKYALALSALGAAALLAAVLWRRRLGPARTVLAVALAAAYPLAADLIYIMVPHASVHTLMIYGLAYILVIPVAMAEYAGPVLRDARDALLHGVVSWVILLSMAMTAYSYIVTDNRTYLKIDLGMRQCEAYSTRLLERIESCEGYVQGMPVMLVGSEVAEYALYPMPEMGFIRVMGEVNLAGLRSSYTYGYFLRNFLGFPGPVYVGGSQEVKETAALEEVQAMPLYPQTGGVQIIDGAVVVRLN